jgi:AcrR family transcriptional regulator
VTPVLPRPVERRRHREREHARRAILEATEALLLEEGYERFSIRRLVDRCGYTAPTIYHHFGDKRGLIDELVEERFRDVLERAPAVAAGEDPVQTLRVLTAYFVRFGIEHPDYYRLLTDYRPDDAKPLRSAEQIKALVEVPLAALAAAGRLRTADVNEAFQAVWALVHGLTALRINRPDEDWSPSLNEFALSALLRGLVCEPSEDLLARPEGAPS